jgi:uncharacterized protein
MTVSVDLGLSGDGQPAVLDLEELLATRLLVQGNSGSGKSHLLRRLLERSAGWVQQIVIDPEGDFVTLADRFGHLVVDGADHAEAELAQIALRVREHRASLVLSLEGLEADGQLRAAAGFLGALFDAPRAHWYPALVVVDEAQLFAPAAGGEVAEDARRQSLAAMTNLMCRGRKRGLAGVIATQRLAKLAKNVAADASNFLMGRTFLDIDMQRAADLLGMERRQAEAIRDLERGQFLALGPALSRRPLAVRVGAVETSARSGSFKLTPLPEAAGDQSQLLLFEPAPPRPAPPPSPPAPPPPARAASAMEEAPAAPAAAAPDEAGREAVIAAALRDMLDEPEAAFRPVAMLFQDFNVRCRMQRLAEPGLDLAGFKGRLSLARAGLFAEPEAEDWQVAIAAARALPEDLQGLFLHLAAAAREGSPCPPDAALAAVYGTRSPSRVRRLLGFLEARQALVIRTDMKGLRSITLPALGWTTGAADPLG